MPAPHSAISTDYWLYEYIYNPLASKVCFVDPNIVTIACFLLVIPLMVGLATGWPLWLLLLVAFLRQSLDNMDGAIARQCDRKSHLGSILDISEDGASVFLLWGLTLWILIHKRSISTGFVALFTLAGLVAMAHFIHVTWNTIRNVPVHREGIVRLGHDNSVVLSLVSIAVLKYLIDY